MSMMLDGVRVVEIGQALAGPMDTDAEIGRAHV